MKREEREGEGEQGEIKRKKRLTGRWTLFSARERRNSLSLTSRLLFPNLSISAPEAIQKLRIHRPVRKKAAGNALVGGGRGKETQELEDQRNRGDRAIKICRQPKNQGGPPGLERKERHFWSPFSTEARCKSTAVAADAFRSADRARGGVRLEKAKSASQIICRPLVGGKRLSVSLALRNPLLKLEPLVGFSSPHSHSHSSA